MQKYTIESFCQKVIDIHGDKYDLSQFIFTTVKEKGKVICKECGNEFYMSPSDLFRNHGCPQCKFIKLHNTFSKTTEEFINDAKNIHGDKYNYSKVNYINNKTKVTIICPIHGEFNILPTNLLRGQGCGQCSHSRKITQEEFIQRARTVHGDKYNYSKVHYINREIKVKIICPIHGEFEIMPYKHLIGQGCKQCRQSHLETFVKQWLEDNQINYENEYKNDWLGRQTLDFYLPDYKIGIECQGIQHLKPIPFYGGDEKFKYVEQLDETKYGKCQQNHVNIIYVIEEQYLPNLTQFYHDKTVITNISNLKDFL
jgi:hypothetical protein